MIVVGALSPILVVQIAPLGFFDGVRHFPSNARAIYTTLIPQDMLIK